MATISQQMHETKLSTGGECRLKVLLAKQQRAADAEVCASGGAAANSDNANVDSNALVRREPPLTCTCRRQHMLLGASLLRRRCITREEAGRSCEQKFTSCQLKDMLRLAI